MHELSLRLVKEDFRRVNCVYNKSHNIHVQNEKIKDWWKKYFNDLLNDVKGGDMRHLDGTGERKHSLWDG